MDKQNKQLKINLMWSNIVLCRHEVPPAEINASQLNKCTWQLLV